MNLDADLRHPVLHLERYEIDDAVAIDRAAIPLGLTPFNGAAPLLLLNAPPAVGTAGLVDFFSPGRGTAPASRCSSSAIVHTARPVTGMAPSVTAPSLPPGAGTYLVVLQFSVVDQTMSLPALGQQHRHTSTVKDVGSLGALWTSAAGDSLSSRSAA